MRGFHGGNELCKYGHNTFSGMKPCSSFQFSVTLLPKASLTALQSDQSLFLSASPVFLEHIFTLPSSY